MMEPIVLRAAERVALPWKNGGGVTCDVARAPLAAGMGDFDWRVSIAKVNEAGPFSNFPGVDRLLAVLDGELVLSGASIPDTNLRCGDQPIGFSGDSSVVGEPHGGAVTDCNLMLHRGRFSGRMQWVTGSFNLAAASSGEIRLFVAAARSVLSVGSAVIQLKRHDGVVLPGHSSRRSRASTAGLLIQIQPLSLALGDPAADN